MRRLISLLLLFPLIVTCTTSGTDHSGHRREILAVLESSRRGWNSGDLETYMQAYDGSDSTRFAGDNSYRFGWDTILAGYKRGYPDRAAMGHLIYSELDVTLLSPDAALVFGRYTMERENDTPTGLFTLIFRKTESGWKIVHDHSSS